MSKLVKKSYDIVIMGGGVIGTSIALQLTRHGCNNVAVIERDNCYTNASAMLSAGGIRQQFSVPENILMSMYGAEFLKNMNQICSISSSNNSGNSHRNSAGNSVGNSAGNSVGNSVDDANVQFHENGYLFLASESGRSILINNNKTQHSCGANWIKLLELEQLQQQYPWLNLDGISIGSGSNSNEGYFDPWLFLKLMKDKARSNGVTYIDGTVTTAKLEPITTGSSDYNIRFIQTTNKDIPIITAGTFVNAAGAWAGKLVDTFKDTIAHPNRICKLPVQPRKRCIFTVHCPGLQPCHKPPPPNNSPLVIDPSGVYFRSEGQGNKFLVGVSPSAERDIDCISDDVLRDVDHDLFDEIIWPTLYERVPAFQELKVLSSWAGFYDYNTLDQNAIIGYHSEIRNLMLCNGFSGHGLQQSPAAGRATAELLTNDNKFLTLDISRFSFERIVNNSPIFEDGIV